MSKQSCSSCNGGYNSCRTCNSCQSCNTSCNTAGGCNSAQNFCSTNQRVGSFSFNQCHTSGQTVQGFRTDWNRLINYINTAYAAGRKQNGGDSGLPTEDTNDFLTAKMFNAIAIALGNLGSTGPSRRVKGKSNGDTTEDVIYGSYFEELETYANQLQYNSNQCNSCNLTCNSDCCSCQKCNVSNCGSCNGSCQSHTGKVCCGCESNNS